MPDGKPVPSKRTAVRVLLLSRYGRRAPNSRLRSYQYLPFLESRGIRVRPEPFSSDRYLRDFYAGKPLDRLDVLRSYAQRLFRLLQSHRYDLLWVEHEMLPYLPAAAESMCRRMGIAYVVDYDDAVFDRYRRHADHRVRRWLGGKIDAVMRNAAAVVCGNRYLADYARRAGARRVEILPTVVDLFRYPEMASSSRESFTIGWIGTRTTAAYLQQIAPALQSVAGGEGTRIVSIGSGPVRLNGVPLEAREWSEATEVDEVRRFDVGVMPLPDDPWTRGKCGYKLIQYMACSLPVVASPVGANPEIVENGKTGYLAGSTKEWVEALEKLRKDPELRREMGRRGYRKVKERYALQVTAPRLEDILRDAMDF